MRFQTAQSFFTGGLLLCAVAFINPGSAHAQRLSPAVYGCPWNADSPVAGCQELEQLTIPSHLKYSREIAFLRRLPKLRMLGTDWLNKGTHTAERFWAEYDQKNSDGGAGNGPR